jgi:hypothetical protein
MEPFLGLVAGSVSGGVAIAANDLKGGKAAGMVVLRELIRSAKARQASLKVRFVTLLLIHAVPSSLTDVVLPRYCRPFKYSSVPDFAESFYCNSQGKQVKWRRIK